MDIKKITHPVRPDGRHDSGHRIPLDKLSEAERDRDHIYGLIRGTAENHGGRSASLTAPNPQAQTDVLKSAYQKAGIHPSTITYIEAHGTGTALGDPIEINALKKAFQTDGAPGGYCGIGSVKTNIGHLELAAGIAGVIFPLLCFCHNVKRAVLQFDMGIDVLAMQTFGERPMFQLHQYFDNARNTCRELQMSDICLQINALKKAFQTDGAPGGYCGIGSVKTNIGHLELAAGIAGVIKVLMQLKHRTLAKSLHCENINPCTADEAVDVVPVTLSL